MEVCDVDINHLWEVSKSMQCFNIHIYIYVIMYISITVINIQGVRELLNTKAFTVVFPLGEQIRINPPVIKAI